ncbi:uncharacterized protein [Nicotiana sylvestris]|uniref:uncharacterized protein n=1 Tax=Nicotiana sylvestris TaxID=4096 RepID=UPI00388C7CC9
MTNPQDNPGTPPQPTPSDLSTPHPPSMTPKPRLRRVKMLARKTVASGALSKKLNEQLKASQAQDSNSNSDSESYKFASEGERPGSSNSAKAQESPSKVSSSLIENLENRFVLVGPIRDVELPELRRSEGKKKVEKENEREGECGDVRGKGKGVADYSPTVVLPAPSICGKDEPGSSTEETLADHLKKVRASYDPKKKTPTPKSPSALKPSKKRKASSQATTAPSLPKGRATRSMVKQSESDLQKALAESKKKRIDKGKGKVTEPSKAVDVKEMEQIHQEKVTTMEVQTPKPKKIRTSSKKSSSVSEAPEPSFAKRTRSAVKGKQGRVSEEEEWSGDEESESYGKQDKLAMFGKRNFLKGRLLKDLVEPGMVCLVDTLAAQGWKAMVLQMDGILSRNEIIEFMANAEVKDGKVTSKVKGVQVTFDAEKLGEILDIPAEGYDDYTR